MADMVRGQIQQHADVRISQSVVDPSPVPTRAHHIGGPQQPERLTHHVLRHARKPRHVTDTQLTGLQQGMQNRQPGGIPEQPEQLRSLDVRLTPRHPPPERLQRCRRLVAVRRTHIEIHDSSLASRSHDTDNICAGVQISTSTIWDVSDMAITALVLYLAWVSLVFGWRTIDQRRRTGDTGLRLAAPRNTAQWWAKIGFALAMLVGLAAPVAAIAGLDNVDPFDARWLHIAGVVLTIVGTVLTVGAQYSMGEAWRIGVDPGERTELVTDGSFRLVRNPVFSAMLVTATGLAAVIPNAASIAGLAALVAATEMQVRLVEEP